MPNPFFFVPSQFVSLSALFNTSAIAQTKTKPNDSFLFACSLYYCQSFHTYFIIKACDKCGAKEPVLTWQTASIDLHSSMTIIPATVQTKTVVRPL